MRITGTLHSVGTIHECGDQIVHGILITADDETLHTASNLLSATVDIYPHPVNGLVAGECTPENYAHALARLAHAEEVSPTADHLAREVRSSQALAAALEETQTRIAELTQLLAIAEGSAAKYEQKYIEASRKDKT